MKQIYTPFMANLIISLERVSAKLLYFRSELRSEADLSTTDLLALGHEVELILEECKMNYTHKETRDGISKTTPRRKTGFHKGDPMVRYLDESNTNRRELVDGGSHFQHAGTEPEGLDHSHDDSGLHDEDGQHGHPLPD